MKKRLLKVILAVVISISMIATNMLIFAEEKVEGVEPTSNTATEELAAPKGTSLSFQMAINPVKKNPDGSPKFTYRTGEAIGISNSIKVSGTDAPLEKAYMEVNIPRDTGRPNVGADKNCEDIKIIENTVDGEQVYQVIFTYKTLGGGIDDISIPMTIEKCKGREIEISQVLYESDGTVIDKKITKFTTEDTVPSLRAQRRSESMAGLPDDIDSTIIKADGAKPVHLGCTVQGMDIGGYNRPYFGEGRIFIKLPTNGKFANTAENGDWIYEPNSHAVYKDIVVKESQSPYVYVEFPGEKFGSEHEFTAIYVEKKDGESLPTEPPQNPECVATGSVILKEFTEREVQIIQPYTNVDPYEFDGILCVDENIRNEVERIPFTLRTANGSDEAGAFPVYVTEMKYSIDSDTLVAKEFDFKLMDSHTMGENVLIGIDKAGVEHEIKKNIVEGERYTIPKEYKSVVLRFNEPIEIKTKWMYGGVFLGHLSVGANLDGTYTVDELIDSGNYVELEVSYYQTPGKDRKATDRERIEITRNNKPIHIYHNWYNNPAEVLVGNKRNYNIHIETNPSSNRYKPNEVVLNKKCKVVALLPEGGGVEYVHDSEYTRSTMVDGSVVPKVEIIDNYKNTGRMALLFDWTLGFNGGLPNLFSTSLHFEVKYTEDVRAGENIIDYYVDVEGMADNWDRNQMHKATDIYDINGNGSTTDIVLHKTILENFRPPASMHGNISINRSGDYFSRFGEDIDSTGGAVKYKMQWNNNKETEVRSLTAINLLPRKGDNTIVKNGEGVYAERGSKLDIYLSEAIVAPAGTKITYSTETPEADAETIKTQKFVDASQITDFTKVTMFKVELVNGAVVKPKEQLEIVYNGKTLAMSNVEEGDTAYNSYAYAVDGGRFTECTPAAVSVVKYHVGGTLFFDKNHNGIMDQEEIAIKDYEFSLINSESGKIVKARTDEKGRYDFLVLERGNYKLSLIKNKDDITTVKSDGEGIVNQMPSNGDALELSLMPTSNRHTVNAGIHNGNGTLAIIKVGEDGKPLGGVLFELVDTMTNERQQGTTTEDGKLSFVNLIQDRVYKLIEKSAPEAYVVPTTETEIVATAGNMHLSKKLVNVLKKGSIEITVLYKKDGKVVPWDRNICAVPWVSLIELDDQGNPIRRGITPTDVQDGKLIFDQPLGTYQIYHTPPPGYVAENPAPVITIKEPGEVIKKDIYASEITATLRVRVEGANPVIRDFEEVAGAKMGIQKIDGSGKPIGDKQVVETGADGQVDTLLSVGEYMVTTEEVPEAFRNANQSWKVNIDKDGVVKYVDLVLYPTDGTIDISVVDSEDGKTPIKSPEIMAWMLDKKGNKVGDGYRVPIDETGHIEIPGASYGNYLISQIVTADGYILPTEEKRVSITKQDEIQKVVFMNDKTSLDITTVGENGMPIGSAVFELIDTKTGMIEEGVSDAEGKLRFAGLIIDRAYKLRQKSAPEGYFADKTESDVTVTATQGKIAKRVVNNMVKGAIDLQLVDREDAKLPIEGAKFQLLPIDMNDHTIANGKTVDVTTDKDGKAEIEDVFYGRYKLVQISSKEGYEVNVNPTKVDIRRDGIRILITVDNAKIKEEPNAPATPEDPTNPEGGVVKPISGSNNTTASIVVGGNKSAKTSIIRTGDDWQTITAALILLIILSMATMLMARGRKLDKQKY